MELIESDDCIYRAMISLKIMDSDKIVTFDFDTPNVQNEIENILYKKDIFFDEVIVVSNRDTELELNYYRSCECCNGNHELVAKVTTYYIPYKE